VLGIAPKAKVLPIRIYSAKGYGGGDAIAIGIDEAVKRGVKIISISQSAHSADSATEIRAVARAQEAGVLVFAGSGNQPDDHYVAPPARYPGAIAVGAVDKKGDIAAISTRGQEVQLVAPGVDITSTSKINKAAGTQYRRGTGTSPATAITAGVAALVWSKYPQLTADEVLERMIRTAVDKGTPGRDPDYGFGMIDPVAALTAPAAQPSPSADAAQTPEPGATGPTRKSDRDADSGRLGLLLLVIGGVVVALGLLALLIGIRVARGRRNRGQPPPAR
jgi:subtilisin family serine protease